MIFFTLYRVKPVLVWVFVLFNFSAMANESAAQDLMDFNRDIRPILSDKCFYCHGPDRNKREAGLRLDVEDEAKDDVIIENDAESSELFLRIISDDEDEMMPPPASKKVLTDVEKEKIKKWINQGARYSKHWSFEPIVKASIPNIKPEGEFKIANPIDAFIVDKLKSKRFRQSPRASKEVWIRRVTFDLTGLPPTLDEIDEFVGDESAAAFEKVVDRLLESDAFGQRMAADWLDAARYSDTYGYQVDRDRFVWPWRDWVIRAFNENKPYDQFLTEQLAGDLLDNPSRDQILATTFNRLHPQKVEGGSVEEEFRIEYVADRAQTASTAMLGLTMECARCHDHKFDPISQKEYFELTAFFDNIDEAGLYSFFTNSVPTPTLNLPTEKQSLDLERLSKNVTEHEESVQTFWNSKTKQMDAKFEDWRKTGAPFENPKPVLHLSFEDFSNKQSEGNRSVAGKIGKAIELSGDHAYTTKVGNFGRHEPFSVSLWLNTPDSKKRAVVFHRSRAWTDAASRGYELLFEDGKLSFALIHFWPGNAIRVLSKDAVPINQWVHVAITYDGCSREEGLRIFVDGKAVKTKTSRDHLSRTIRGGGNDNITIGERFRDRGFTGGMVDEFKVFDRQLSEIEVLCDFSPEVKTDLESKNKLTSLQMRELFLSTQTPPEFKQLLKELKAVRNRYFDLQDRIPEIMVMNELPRQRPTYVLERGIYDAPKEPVGPATPSALPPMNSALPRNRLGLAKWMTSPNNPLPARVAVNRYWQVMFGNGLVTTPEDFGSQGKSPTHPELLDFLAAGFIESGWDIKKLLKKIAMSHTYQQSSDMPNPKDPENLYLSFSPRFRLSAEMLRDNALFVSGLLVDKIGGPPVRPYELTESFKPVKADSGEGLYRRSLYTYWKRTGPAPAMMALDAAKRDVCQVRRERTSGPLQAFVLQNSPQIVEAARALSERVIEFEGNQQSGTIKTKSFVDLFRMLTSRQPNSKEIQILRDLFEAQMDYFADNEQANKQFLGVGQKPIDEKIPPHQLAAFTVVAITVLNFDHSVIRR